jgi:hypothetical protein
MIHPTANATERTAMDLAGKEIGEVPGLIGGSPNVEFEAVWDERLEIGWIDGGQLGIRENGGCGDERVELETAGTACCIEEKGSFPALSFGEREHSAREHDSDNRNAFGADGPTLGFPPCQAGYGGLWERSHELEGLFPVGIGGIREGDEKVCCRDGSWP